MRDRLAALIPGWTAYPGTPENAIIEANALEHAETRRAATGEGQTFDTIARRFGQSIFGVIANDPVAASGSATVTMIDTAGYTLPSGTQFTLRAADGSRVGFETTAAVTVPAGQTASAAGAVGFVAVLEGDAGNDLIDDPRLEDEWDFVATFTVVAPTSGGSDGETDTEYLGRFARTARRFSPRLITVDDFGPFTNDFFADGGRALVIDLYNPDTGSTTSAGSLTVVPITPAGQPRSNTQKVALKAAMEAQVLSGAQVFVIDPTYTPVSVSFTISVYPPYDPSATLAAATAAVQAFLDPATWGMAPYGDEPLWLDEPIVRAADIDAVLKAVSGVRHVLDLVVNGADQGDVVLIGPAALPSVGTVSGAVAS